MLIYLTSWDLVEEYNIQAYTENLHAHLIV